MLEEKDDRRTEAERKSDEAVAAAMKRIGQEMIDAAAQKTAPARETD